MANVKPEVWRRNGRDIERIRAWEVINWYRDYGNRGMQN